VFDLTGDEFGLFTQAVIRSWLLGQSVPSHPAYPLPDYPVSALYVLLDGLRLAIMKIRRTWDYLYPFPGVSFFPCPNRESLTAAKVYILYATAFKGIVNWPQGFCEFLDAYQSRDGRQSSYHNISKDLGPLYTWIKNHLESCQFVQEVFEQYVRSYGLTHPPPLLKLEPQIGWNNLSSPIEVSQAVGMLGNSKAIVERLVQLGLLMTYRELKNGKLFVTNYPNWVSKVEVIEWQQKWANGIPVADVAKIFDISEVILLRLVDTGLIEADSDKRFSYGAITDFMNRLRANTNGWFPRKHRQQPIPLEVVVSVHGLDPAEVVRLVLAKEIRGYWPGGENRLSRLRIYHQDVKGLAESIQTNR